MDTLNGLTLAAEKHVTDWYGTHSNPKLSFHNMALTRELVRRIQEIGEGEHLSEDVIARSVVAAYFSQTGYAVNPDHPIQQALYHMNAFFDVQGVDEFDRASIKDCLLLENEDPTSKEGQLYHDGYNSLILGDSFGMYHSLFRMESQFLKGESINKSTINAWYLSLFNRVQFYTSFAKAKYQTQFLENKAGLEQSVKKKRNRLAQSSISLGGITPNNANREIQTYYRTAFNHHTQLLDISDNKARIMISVNSILVSVLISLLTYNFAQVTNSRPMLIVPIIIFLIAAVGSLIFAILSSRPTLPDLPANKSAKERMVRNMFSFTQFVHLDQATYLDYMDSMLRDGSLVLASMSNELYRLGKVLDKKYHYLTLSYNIFMVGFVTTVVVFMVVYFL